MKKFLSIYGSILFLFVSYFLTSMEGSISLYKNPVGFRYFNNAFDLSPLIMIFIYLVVLIGIIVSIKRKKFYIATTVGNLIISIPIFMVHKDTLFFDPFRYLDSSESYGSILSWLWYIYLSILGAMILLIYLFVKSRKYTPQQLNNIKKLSKIALITIIVVIVIYVAQCLYLSLKTYYLVNLAYNTNGQYSEGLKDTISEKDFGWLEGKVSITEEHYNTFPITFLLGNKAYSAYQYTYEKTDSIEGLIGGAHEVKVKVKWKFENFRWIVVKVIEHI